MYAVIRIRGDIGLSKELRYAMKLLRLTRVNHLVLVKEGESNKYSINKVRDYVSYGEIDAATLEKLIEKRGRITGNKRLDEEFLKKNKIKSFKELAEQIISGKKTLMDFKIKPVFRLGPPRKGFERRGIKKSYNIGGALGYRAADINKLILRMI